MLLSCLVSWLLALLGWLVGVGVFDAGCCCGGCDSASKAAFADRAGASRMFQGFMNIGVLFG